MNSQLIAWPDVPTIRFSRILRHASTIPLFVENRLEGETKVNVRQPNNDLGQPATFALRFVARHNGAGNLAFGDGHIASFAGPRVVETKGPLQGGPILPPIDICWSPD